MKRASVFLPMAALGFVVLLTACSNPEGGRPEELNPYSAGQSGMSPGAQGSAGAPAGSVSSADTPMM